MKARALFLTLLLCCPAWGQPAVKLPASVAAKPGRMALLRAELSGGAKEVRWVSLSEEADVLPYLGTSAIFVAAGPGKYRVLAYSCAADVPSDPAVCVVVVEGPAPPTPPPAPPPAPPDPAPPPDDPLARALQAAYAAEADPARAASRASLAALYRQGADAAARGDVTTFGQLFDVMRLAATSLGVSGKLAGVQSALSGELKRTLPTSRAAALDAGGRDLAARTFRRVAALLEGLK